METKNVLSGIVSLTVVVICVAAIMMPVLNDATQTHETFDNSQYAYYQMKELENGDSWTRTNNQWSYGEEALTSSSNSQVSVIATDNLVVRQSGHVRGTLYVDNNAVYTDAIQVDSADYLRINNSSSGTISYTSGYGAVVSGDYVLKTYDSSAYVNEATAIWASGVTSFGTSSTLFTHIEGSIEDGLTITVNNAKNNSVTDITVGEPTINYEAVDGYIDLYRITSIEFEVTGTESETSVTQTFTYSSFVLPKEITAELSQHMTDGENAIINMIPIVVIASIVVAAVGLVVTGRRD